MEFISSGIYGTPNEFSFKNGQIWLKKQKYSQAILFYFYEE